MDALFSFKDTSNVIDNMTINIRRIATLFFMAL
jgi:hypothetical protein